MNYYKFQVFRTVWYWNSDRSMESNKSQYIPTCLYIYGTVVDHRCAIIEHCKCAWIVPKRCSNNCLLIWGGKKMKYCLTLHTKKHFQWEQRFQYEKQNFKIFRCKYRKITLWLQNRVKKKTRKFLAVKENTGIILIYNYIDGLNFCHHEWFLTKD